MDDAVCVSRGRVCGLSAGGGARVNCEGVRGRGGGGVRGGNGASLRKFRTWLSRTRRRFDVHILYLFVGEEKREGVEDERETHTHATGGGYLPVCEGGGRARDKGRRPPIGIHPPFFHV